MVRISAAELQRQWGRVQDMALAEPVTITSNGRDRMVLLSADEYLRLKRRDREVLGFGDFADDDLLNIKRVEPTAAARTFNHELED